ncbi:MAG TPA: 3-oxoacyl-[acyl-carrier-protein] synthase III C-terminal domain-containing protein [Candidatus Dormibacteraeota bacterium]|nr:3-oxoacyl-[acyl-carrier-protein] synthase III C-terminal domain-containing protein [Candidatus Dormibacteraeota bacterium]
MALGMALVPRLAAIATSVPSYVLEQDDVVQRVRAIFKGEALVQRLLPVFENSGIRRRYSCVPVEWYYEPHDWKDRNAVYLDCAVPLLERAASDVLERAGARVDDVAAIVAVSTTGVATPSLDALLVERMGFPRTVRRLPIFGLGCAGGALGLARAASVARDMPGKSVLFLVVELCTLSFRREEVTKSNVVANALFGDGAAAALLSTQARGPAIVASGEHLFEDSLDVMGWDVAADGLRAIFSRDIPALVATRFRGVLDAYLAEQDLTMQDVDHVIPHPGGVKVLDALERAFGLAPGALDDSRAVLREYGNMSAATVLFVLERALSHGALRGDDWNRALVTAMGPGFTAGFVTLER